MHVQSHHACVFQHFVSLQMCMRYKAGHMCVSSKQPCMSVPQMCIRSRNILNWAHVLQQKQGTHVCQFHSMHMCTKYDMGICLQQTRQTRKEQTPSNHRHRCAACVWHFHAPNSCALFLLKNCTHVTSFCLLTLHGIHPALQINISAALQIVAWTTR
jgi:hypothetical protein